MTFKSVFLPAVFILFFGMDLLALLLGWKEYDSIKNYPAKIISGSYVGRQGNIVSIPWMFNGYNTMASINVPMNEAEIREFCEENNGWNVKELLKDMQDGQGRRTWVTVWSWQIKRI